MPRGEGLNTTEAIACFDKAIEVDPRDTANYCERGNAYLLKGDADAAIADFTQFIRLNQVSARPPCVRRHLELEVEEFGDVTVVKFADKKILDEQSIQAIGEQLFSLVDELGRKKIVLDLGNVEYLSRFALNRFVVLHKKLNVAGEQLGLCGLLPEIYEVFRITKLDKLFKIGPHPGKEDPGANLGGVASRLEPPSAADFLESRLWRNGLAIAHANRGAAYCYKGEYDAAIADYTEAIGLHRTFANAYVNRGNAYCSKRDYHRAIADHTEAIRLQPRDPQPYRERAEAYRALGDEDNAGNDERKMSACDYSVRGEAHLEKGEVEEAIATQTEAIRLDPSAERYAARARAFLAKRDYGRAIADYSEAIRLDPRDAGIYLMRAEMYRLRGDESLAAEDERTMEELACGGIPSPGVFLAEVVASDAVKQREDIAVDVSGIVEGGNQFALNLYRQLCSVDGNLFFSPSSISTALAMTYAGAAGETKAEMARTLQFKLKDERLHDGMKALQGFWTTPDKQKGVRLNLANRLWGQKSYEFLPAFLEVTRDKYGAELARLDFAQSEQARQAINTWVEDQTENRITDLIPARAISSDTSLVLTNAVYFHGIWAGPFEKNHTKDEDFHLTAADKIKVPMMHRQDEFRYGTIDDLQILELPYGDGSVSMIVFLPKAIDSLADLEAKLTLPNLRRWTASLTQDDQVKVDLPKRPRSINLSNFYFRRRQR